LSVRATLLNGTPKRTATNTNRWIPRVYSRRSDTASRAATALAQLLQARHGFTTGETAAQRDATTAALISAGEQLRQAGEEIDGFFRLAEASWAAGRRGRDDLS
jgi:hypothetical protein